MGRSNVTAMRELALRRAAIARAIKQPLPKGKTLREIVSKRRQKQRQEMADVEKRLTDMKNETAARNEREAAMLHR